MRLLGTCALFVLALVFVPSASASHAFSDVPDGHPFHTEIGIFKGTNITAGCSPTEYCPSNNLQRQGMAAFITRALGLVVRPNESTQSGVPGSRVAMLDDDLTFVGTQHGALELSFGGVQALRLEQGGGLAPNVIGGFSANAATENTSGATIAGGGISGFPNLVGDSFGSIGGGATNVAGDLAGTFEDRPYATVGGGLFNRATGSSATIGGGNNHFASGENATIAGGASNDATALSATAGGGAGNIAGGQYATVPGGRSNVATADYTFAAGRRGRADDLGAWVWADSQDAALFSPGANTFSVRAQGGIWLGTGAAPASMTAGRFLDTSTGAHLTSAGAWTNNSDRALKERFSGVDGQRLLRALAGIPIQSWSYKAEPGVRHLGPVAQDFYRAFRLGHSKKHIATVDADGVALAAIQALYRENRALESRLAQLERQMAQLLRGQKRR